MVYTKTEYEHRRHGFAYQGKLFRLLITLTIISHLPEYIESGRRRAGYLDGADQRRRTHDLIEISGGVSMEFHM